MVNKDEREREIDRQDRERGENPVKGKQLNITQEDIQEKKRKRRNLEIYEWFMINREV